MTYLLAMAGPDFDAPQLTAMGLLIEVYEGVTARLTPVHARHGISGNDFDTLIRLARSPLGRLRMTDLAVQTSMSTSGITRVVDRLHRHGLVRREPCPDDRRSSFAVLTEDGRDRVREVLTPLVEEIEACFTGVLDSAQLPALLDALRAVRETVRPGASAGALSPFDHAAQRERPGSAGRSDRRVPPTPPDDDPRNRHE